MTKKKKRRNIPKQNIPVTPKKEKRGFWFYAIGIAALLSVWPIYVTFKEYFLSPKEKFRKENYVSGELKSPMISVGKYKTLESPMKFVDTAKDDAPRINGILIKQFRDTNFVKLGWIFVQVGRYFYTCSPIDFLKGIDIFNPTLSGCTDAHLLLGVKNDRLYVSAEFKDLQNEQTIGFIQFNHWSLYKPNLLDFDNDDKRLEVKDKQHNIVFSISYESIGVTPSPVVHISGYFISPTSILILGNVGKEFKDENECISKTDSTWKQRALTEISTIKSIF